MPAATVSEMRRVPGSGVGVLLGMFNVLVISAGMGIAAHEPGVAFFVFMFTIIPGVFAGAILGALADASARRAPALRYISLGGFALAVLSALASFFDLMDYVPLAAIPTAVAVILLEGATRRRPVDPPIPVATVR
jgi:hypothetical protein